MEHLKEAIEEDPSQTTRNLANRFNYVCPEPTDANAWPLISHGQGPLVIRGDLRCGPPNYIWRNALYGPMQKFSCMSEARTRCGGCVDIYKPKDPCDVNNCAPRDFVSLWVMRDPRNKKQCLLNFLCPVGTVAFTFDEARNAYVRASGQALTCTDNGPGSSWYRRFSSPEPDIHVTAVSCFSET
ncbi:hypothetical protein Y032_0312g2182 [Ancylostoma ceylanicum]|uniref:Uncharacterized protein n=1 Tax=Ancylostoma ceylanicum TaxID=53326 RepID=A0A016S2X2_9BILA|nr:hypothetical protein Y032_0312g2182 [Ancylostoma ceylanicum]